MKNKSIEQQVEEFEEIWPLPNIGYDGSEQDVNQRKMQYKWIKNALQERDRIAYEKGAEKGRQIGVIGSEVGDFKAEEEVERIKRIAREEERADELKWIDKILANCEEAKEAGSMSQFGSASGSMMLQSAIDALTARHETLTNPVRR